MELPSITKKMILNLNMILGIVILTLAIVVFLWQVLPVWIEQTEFEAEELAVEFQYWPDVYRGQDWEINVTVSNAGGRHVRDIDIIVVSDEYVTGGEAIFDILMGGKAKTAVIRGKIKQDAPLGEHSVVTVATASKANVTTQSLDITVFEPSS